MIKTILNNVAYNLMALMAIACGIFIPLGIWKMIDIIIWAWNLI